MAEQENATGKPETDSLDATQTVVESDAGAPPAGGVVDATEKGAAPAGGPLKTKKKQSPMKWVLSHLNVYFLLFLFILVIAGAAVMVSYQTSKKEDTTSKEVKVQNLSDDQLKALQTSSTKVGDPKSVLNIESNAIFAGKVLISGGLEVAGTIKVGGPLALSGLTVGGDSQFDTIKANNLQVSANSVIQGQLNVQKSLTVAGGATFGGPISAPQLNIDTLSIAKDLVISHHIVAGGTTPGISYGTALGGGGTASVSGSDTAGTITINTGANPPVGCFATIAFTQKFNTTPHISISPVGSDAGALDYYIIRNTSTMSVCSVNSAAAGRTFFFDYVAFD